MTPQPHTPLPMRRNHIKALRNIAAAAENLAEDLLNTPRRDHYDTRRRLLFILDTLHLILYNEDTYGHHHHLK